MKQNITRKILQSHLVEGQMIAGEEISIKIDQTLTQDATGTMSYLAFEALGIPKVRTEVSVSYIDHNTLQAGFENADDHIFLQTIAKKHGIYCSRPGNGICHQLHTERFAAPGKTLLGSDSHTPTSGALGMIAIGAGGMSVAMAMAGQPFPLVMPQVINVKLTGKLRPGVAAKDVILEILRIMTVKGGVGKVLEYTGPGVETLSITERQTITNMGAELGVTTSLFPSDKVAYEFMKAQGREENWVELLPDEDAQYDGVMEINLAEIEPMVAQPSMPDKVVKIKDLEKTKLHQVFIGSCTNASYSDLAKAAAILEGKCVHPDVSLSVAAGSKQVFEMIARDGILQKLIASGARVLESACGPCVGIGQAPPSAGVSLRTSNRNFRGRSGTKDAQVYLASPEVAAASAITGVISDPKDVVDVNILESIKESMDRIVDDRMLEAPVENTDDVVVRRGPNIQPLPLRGQLDDVISAPCLIKVEDNITTDDIMPAGAKILPLRSNVPAISQYVFNGIDPTFAKRAKESENGGFIVAGENYGQGSSREHAALAPMYLGIQVVLAKSFARIHHDNLINYGILPLRFTDAADYDRINQDDKLVIKNVKELVNKSEFVIANETQGFEIKAYATLSDRQKEVLLAGGQLNFIKKLL
ncbi:aconitate hydratase [Clostridium saccharobutylicum]|uniref:3-isopropylmalate dehydratase large subunit 1 n=1 Tax=Clostridium saccharobutylicum DSM 13864 TaxID=1345695 RepID=U5MV42_CLOSA|nr:aconitate hydratase [Clostridium saccharobutylicum]AGX44445.1 3-isopropylmalate dehydratase large subunit 1 [Clostridium saccharobutylicum DSM 13864]AQR91740.1 homoaconitase large subunit [Clostridium saccharobutylicum]AQS01642.1 homoaconitase large subunit [Clostridium saccharobutylicum]AQS11252.1 homoaconitase large subunit [Clostridium saccharobutylicum]AQS15625.1 homoaconitase large subunit [Clostridium saccharobutylicum]